MLVDDLAEFRNRIQKHIFLVVRKCYSDAVLEASTWGTPEKHKTVFVLHLGKNGTRSSEKVTAKELYKEPKVNRKESVPVTWHGLHLVHSSCLLRYLDAVHVLRKFDPDEVTALQNKVTLMCAADVCRAQQ